jgi:hypothetical protein
MTPSDLARLKAWAASQTHNHTIFLSGTSHSKQPVFDAFASDFSLAAPCIRITPSDRETSLPGFFAAENIGFFALPVEKALAPFLETLSCIAGDMPPLSDDIEVLLAQVDRPCRLTLFIAAQCPHCPEMVKTMIPLAVRSKNIDLKIIDGTLFPETAQEYQVLSAPCLILDQDFRWTGQADPREVLTLIRDRDPSLLSTDTLRQILEQGDASWICQQMIRAKAVFENVIALLTHPVWSVRLGAMVVVETMAQENPELASQLCPPLIRAFENMDVTVQGDILYALGEAGNQDTRDWIINTLPGLTHPDLQDAAQEALTAIEQKQ